MARSQRVPHGTPPDRDQRGWSTSERPPRRADPGQRGTKGSPRCPNDPARGPVARCAGEGPEGPRSPDPHRGPGPEEGRNHDQDSQLQPRRRCHGRFARSSRRRRVRRSGGPRPRAPAGDRDRDAGVPPGRSVPGRAGRLDAQGRARRARRMPHDLALATAPGLHVTTTLLLGSRVDALVRHTRDSALLAVGAPPHGLAERLWTGSTVTGTAARVRCPLVIVPPEPGLGPPPRPHRGRPQVDPSRRAPARRRLRGRPADPDATSSSSTPGTCCRATTTRSPSAPPPPPRHRARPHDRGQPDRPPAGLPGRAGARRGRAPPGGVRPDRPVGRRRPAADLPAGPRRLRALPRRHRPAVIREAGCPVEVVPPLDETEHVELVDTASALVP